MAFIEAKDEFSWHKGMLLPESDMQISFFKDLVTLRNPTSKYTFLNYLSQIGRLEEFANLRNFFPSRAEYNDYLRWAAKQFDKYVFYEEKVVNIKPIFDSSKVTHLEIHTKDKNGINRILYTKNLSIATGITKKYPKGICEDNKSVIHSNDFLCKLEENFKDRGKNYQFVIVGSGQSAAEITYHLSENYPNAHINLCFKGYSLRPADETEFSNEIFSSQAAKDFFHYPPYLKERMLLEFRNTNYSVVDPALIKILYNKLYIQKVLKKENITFHNFHELRNINLEKKTANFFSFVDFNIRELNFDGIFLSTGYDPLNMELLNDISIYLCKDDKGKVELDDNYCVKVLNASEFEPMIFIQGASEHSHGLSEILLSLLSYRSQKIVDRLNQ